VGQSKRAAVEFFKPGTVCFLPVDYGGGSFIIRFFVTNEFLDRMFLALMLDDELVVGFGFPIVDRCLIAVFITADGETEGKASNDPALPWSFSPQRATVRAPLGNTMSCFW